MDRVIVLGAGMVGSIIAADLARDPNLEVTAADARPGALESLRTRTNGAVRTISADLSDPTAIRRLVEPYGMVCGALASRLGLSALRAVVDAGKNYCDISFMAEDPREIDAAAKAKGVTCVVDCGVAPGMSHLLAGYEAASFERCDRIEIYVGGLPRERRWPYQYKAPFAPSDVLEEYTRPSRVVERGEVVIKEALSEPELMDFPGVGTLEAFNTDGLRSLATTLKVPEMKERTLRYPGHIELMRVLRATGLMSETPISVGGTRVVPREVLAALMFPMWTFEPGEEDVTVMRVIAEGVSGGKRERRVWDLFDLYSKEMSATSMSRTTAFPCAIVARLIMSGEVKRPGVVVPEWLGAMPGVAERVIREHADRGVTYTRRTEPA